MASKSSINVGNAGEHLVTSILLTRKHHAAMADRGNPAFDILTRFNGKQSAIRVKTSSSQSFQWTAKTDGLYLDYDPADENDFVALVSFDGNQEPRQAVVYIVPTRIIVEAVQKVHSHYHQFTKRDGAPRKETPQRVIRLNGYDRDDNISYDFARKWSAYREAWTLLE